jgi:hypothetical protein
MEPEGDLLGKGHVHSASASETHLEPEDTQLLDTLQAIIIELQMKESE